MGKHYNRKSQERLLKKLSFEVNKTNHIGSIDYLTNKDLMILINGFLFKLGLVTYTIQELEMDLN